MRPLSFIATSLLCLAAAACNSLPVSGPYPDHVESGAATRAVRPSNAVALPYALVDLDARVVSNVPDLDGGSLYASFGRGKGPAPAVLVGPGDVLLVTVFESKSGGLFVPADSGTRPGNFVNLPPMTVEQNGMINVPYGGEVPAAGKSLQRIAFDIEKRLSDRAIEPKVVVSFAEQNAGLVSVVGDVNTAKKVKLTLNGERILDMIAQAGGPHYPGYETFVTLQRGGRRATIYFNSLVRNPDENIYAAPGDTVYVYHEPRRFVALGALGVAVGVGASSALTGLSSLFSFDQDRLTLVEAVGKAGGLLDERANPAQVFVYRLELRKALEAMGVDLRGFPPRAKIIPTVYRSNFRDPSSFFFAQEFTMRDRDVLYAANAESIEVAKFVGYATTVSGGVAAQATNAGLTRYGGTYAATGYANPF
ncbi:MAG: polysaccharide biosynthesis/export family protein [Rhodomicrobium sp.]